MLNRKKIENNRLILYGLFIVHFLPITLIGVVIINFFNIIFLHGDDVTGRYFSYWLQLSLFFVLGLIGFILVIKTLWRRWAFEKTNDPYLLYEKTIDYKLRTDERYFKELGVLHIEKDQKERLNLKREYVDRKFKNKDSGKRVVSYSRYVNFFVFLSSLIWTILLSIYVIPYDGGGLGLEFMLFLDVVCVGILFLSLYRYQFGVVFSLSPDGLYSKSHGLVGRKDIKNISIDKLSGFSGFPYVSFSYTYKEKEYSITLDSLDIGSIELNRLIEGYTHTR